MPIYGVFFIVLLNMTAFRGSKVVVTLFAIELGVNQFYIGALIAMYSVFPMLLGLYAVTGQGERPDAPASRFPRAGPCESRSTRPRARRRHPKDRDRTPSPR